MRNKDNKELIGNMKLKEKIRMLSGVDFMYTHTVKRLRIPSLFMSDGPHGLRCQKGRGNNGVTDSIPSTAFPTLASVACSFDTDIAKLMGECLADECRNFGVNILLGPGLNIKRNPLCGRNFEYFSEDPILASDMASALVLGLQEGGVGACIKHYALNNSENFRYMGNSIVSKRALFEIYLKPFERTIRNSSPAAVMCAYNKVNGVFCSQNRYLMKDILRDRWNYEGVVMTDWGAMKNRKEGVLSGIDLEMPGDTRISRKRLIRGYKDKSLPSVVLDDSINNILNLVNKYSPTEKKPADFEKNDLISEKIAESCAILMKNDGMLPLDGNEKIFVTGALFEMLRYQGAGSSMVNPTGITTVKEAFDAAGIDYVYSGGYSFDGKEHIERALKRAEGIEKAIVFAGLDDFSESEGIDRESLSLPENQLSLISALVHAGKKVCVVLFSGSVLTLPFANDVCAILNMVLPGQRGGEAAYRILFGEVNPSGRLTETWVEKESDVYHINEFSKNENEVYKEDIFVGYRYYLENGIKAAFPFGHGLSYTTFEQRDLALEQFEDRIDVSVSVKNTGKSRGAEVVQIYVKKPGKNVPVAKRELSGFEKVFLDPGEEKQVKITVMKSNLETYDPGRDGFVLEDGEYIFSSGKNAEEMIFSQNIYINGEEISFEPEILEIPPERGPLPLTMNSKFSDFKLTKNGRFVYGVVSGFIQRKLKAAKKLPKGKFRDNTVKGTLFMLNMINTSSIYSLTMNDSRKFPYRVAHAVMNFSNGHILWALSDLLFGTNKE